MQLITKHICMTKDIGIQDNLFGGIMMAWMDEAAAILASEAMHVKKFVTFQFEQIRFINPVKVHETVHFYGEVEHVGNTSVTVRVKAIAYDPETLEEKDVCTTKAVFVHIGEDGHKKQLPKIELSGETNELPF